MNRSRYVPHAVYSINPYASNPYGIGPTQSPMQGGGGMMPPSQAMGMAASQSPYGSPQSQQHHGQSPVQTSLSPNAMWAANFANGPIIEDLCAPPPPPLTMPPAAPPHMRMAAHMHPGAMPQVQNVYGVRQPGGLPLHHHHHPAYAVQGPYPGQPMQGIPTAARVVGTYPPYTSSMPQQPQQVQPGMHLGYHPAGQNATGMLGRPRLETGFPSAPVAAGGPGQQHEGRMGGQMGSPDSGGSMDLGVGTNPVVVSDLEGVAPLTPVEEAIRGFLSPDLGDLGHP
ncbi:uncharacterized protein B0T15DRAFT_533957 [Chaetomium strumarium]|uniref:Uncharacterized protein n=1 Tax=Chaetomium strumarium TaxID=1170767 RepID=A0AAJ0M1X1_9PEZI|nr:hypothetical protein B0T15DRAFT_533957 [Chaetomium strumarium]